MRIKKSNVKILPTHITRMQLNNILKNLVKRRIMLYYIDRGISPKTGVFLTDKAMDNYSELKKKIQHVIDEYAENILQ